MTQRIPPCRFCGADLRRAPSRILVSEGKRGQRKHWGCCRRKECLAQFIWPGSHGEGSTEVTDGG